MFSGNFPTIEQITSVLLNGVPDNRKRLVAEFVLSLFKTYSDLFFTYLEINPLGKNSCYYSCVTSHAFPLMRYCPRALPLMRYYPRALPLMRYCPRALPLTRYCPRAFLLMRYCPRALPLTGTSHVRYYLRVTSHALLGTHLVTRLAHFSSITLSLFQWSQTTLYTYSTWQLNLTILLIIYVETSGKLASSPLLLGERVGPRRTISRLFSYLKVLVVGNVECSCSLFVEILWVGFSLKRALKV